MVAVALLIGFVFGALVVIGVEALGLLFLIRKLGQKTAKEDAKVAKSGNEELQFAFPNKQGWVWVLEKEKIPKISQSTDKNSRVEKRKIEIVEVTPVRKHASIKDKTLVITEPDGTLAKISLLGCIVEAVSATNLPSRKWAKKYPIKVENKSATIYHGSKLFYMYFETSCEKESWCQALRFASYDDKQKLIGFYKSRAEFHSYLASLNVEYPSFLKQSITFNPEIGDKSIKVDGPDSSSSKVRHFLKKLAKRTSKFSENSVGGSSRVSQTEKKPNHGVEERVIQAMTPRTGSSGNKNLGFQNADANLNDKMNSDDGTLCCSLLISRLFFDAKNNVDLRNSIRARIQRTLSTIRTPSYIGEIICTNVNPGNIPPYIHGMRVLPSDLKEVVAIELDIEYYGGAILDIETRLEVQELENSDSKSVDVVASDLLEGFEYDEGHLKVNEQTYHALDQTGDEIRKSEDTKSFRGTEQASSTLPKWKSVLNSLAKQVSQVPLTLAIRVTSLRGTLRVHIKPPPSDQIWFGFTSMPDIDFSLESAVGDHKITSGHIALFLISKFKAAIRESMVLPNSESVTIPFMLAEKNDWVPQKTAPFIWINSEPTPEPATEPVVTNPQHRPQPSDETHVVREPQDVDAHTSNKSSPETTQNKTTFNQSDDEKSKPTTIDEKTIIAEKTVSPESDKQVEEDNGGVVTSPNWRMPPPQAVAAVAAAAVTGEESGGEMSEGELKRMGAKAKMLGLRKKMGEKLEEQRRNIEEKRRHIVEKMRGPGGI